MSTSNHLSPAGTVKNPPALCVWFFHDHRLGHLKQLQGLASRLETHASIQCYWLDIRDYALGLRHLFSAPRHLATFPRPDMIIGAGHGTHLSVLLAARHYKAFSALIMKPSLPLNWFDAIICPEHDRVPSSEKVLSTFGPLNSITPPEHGATVIERTTQLILLGGPSRHFDFDTASLLAQIQQLCQESAQTQWLLSSSPRTPASMLTQLRALALPNLQIHDYRDPALAPMETLLCSADRVWLTPDSMSMIFEALTAGARVGLFDDHARPGKANSRINQMIETLIRNRDVILFSARTSGQQTSTKPAQALWETERAARWLLQRFASHKNQDSDRHAH